jgi:ParB family transcriptional regulator, chromosome partitioning protein
MSKHARQAQLKMIPIASIEVLNPRERNQRIFDDIVGNIKQIGLKKPITVTSRPNADGEIRYLLVCGEGRMKAFKSLGETEIPAMVIDVDDDDAFIMSLAENIARRQCRTLELLSGVQRLKAQGYDKKAIAEKTGLSAEYIQCILQLLEQGEDRLLIAVESGKIPLNTAMEICSAGTDDKAIQIALQEAYEAGHLRGKQLINARRLIAKRLALGKSIRKRVKVKSTAEVTSASLIRSYQREVQRQKLIVKKSDFTQQRLMFVIGALRSLLSNENFTTLLRAEKLDTMPTFLAERVWPTGLAA